MQRLTPAFFPHNVAIQAQGDDQDSSGQVIGGWITLAGLGAVPCRIAPISTAQEQKMAQFVATGADSVILIVDAWPELTTEMRLLGSDGKVYDILAVEIDSVGVMTRVMARTHS
jgi:head-tail joining protein